MQKQGMLLFVACGLALNGGGEGKKTAGSPDATGPRAWTRCLRQLLRRE